MKSKLSRALHRRRQFALSTLFEEWLQRVERRVSCPYTLNPIYIYIMYIIYTYIYIYILCILYIYIYIYQRVERRVSCTLWVSMAWLSRYSAEMSDPSLLSSSIDS